MIMDLDELQVPQRELEKIGRDWITYFNAKDLDNLLNLYDDNAVHYSPRLRKEDNPEGKVVGKTQLREWWQSSFDSLPELQYGLEALVVQSVESGIQNLREAPWKKGTFLFDVKTVYNVEGTILIKYTRTVTGQPETYVAEEFKVKNGKIIESRVYLG